MKPEQLEFLAAGRPRAPRADLSDFRALTLWRPWDWSILHGSKRIENRPWPCPVAHLGTRIALHAGATWDADGAARIREIHPEMPALAAQHPKGAIVGVVRPTRNVTASTDRWFFGPFGWVLADDVIPIEPVPCKGALGLWRMPVAVATEVEARVRAALQQRGRHA